MNLPMTDDVRTADGGPAPWPELFQRRNLLVLFAEDGDEACDRAIAALRSSVEKLDDDDAVPLVVYERAPAKPPDGVTVLVDPGGHLARSLGAGPGKLLAVDRFFEVLKGVDVRRSDPTAAVPEAIGWLDLAEMSCPECGVPTW